MSSWKKIEYRAILRYNFARGLTMDQCLDEMASVLGDDCPSRATAFRWYRQFHRGVFKLEDEPRSGRTVKCVTSNVAPPLRRLIEEDPRITYRQLELLLQISSPSVYAILHDHLLLKKVCFAWAPQEQDENQKASRVAWCRDMLKKFDSGRSEETFSIVTGGEISFYYCTAPSKSQDKFWLFEDDAPITNKQSNSIKRRTIAAFFGKRGIVERVTMDKKTVDWYGNVCLPQVVQALKNLRPRMELDVWHFHSVYNTSTKADNVANDLLKSSKVNVLNHPEHSPDLAPFDFGLFQYIKRQLKGHQFSSDEELITAWDQACAAVPQKVWHNIFDSWFMRMEKCIDGLGEYILKP